MEADEKMRPADGAGMGWDEGTVEGLEADGQRYVGGAALHGGAAEEGV